jgi:excisionase family DNA binding protein
MAISYDYDGAAAALGVARSKIVAAVRENRIAAKKWGKDVLIGHDELVRWFESLEERA